jgi:hypothetical protein
LKRRNEGLNVRSCSSQESRQTPREATKVRMAAAKVARVCGMLILEVLVQSARKAASKATSKRVVDLVE